MILAQKEPPTELQKLQREFDRELAHASREFSAALGALSSEWAGPDNIKVVRHLAHGIAGSAGYFGHNALGRGARRLQQAADRGDISAVKLNLEVMIDLLTDIRGKPDAAREGDPAPASRQGVRILIAEDHSVTQDILKLVLTQRGHSVDIVSDGEAALQALKRASYDVALLDFHLPKMDGVQVASSFIAQTPSPCPTKFIAMTADVEGLLAHKENCENFDKIAPKPVNIAEICEVVEAGREASLKAVAAVPVLSAGDHAKDAAEDDLAALVALDYNFLVWPQDLNPKHLSARALQATIRKENFDAILIKELRGASAISSIWNAKLLHLLPVIDCTGRLGARADYDFSSPTRSSVREVDELIQSFNLRCGHINRDILYSDNPGDKLLARILVSNAPLTPIYDAQSRSLVQYNTVLDVDAINQCVGALTEKRLLKPSFFDRVHSCGTCRSSLFNVREECPQCRSSDIREEAYLHHFKCAYQGPESDFRNKDDLVCPKCRSELRHFGHDYDRPGIMVKCNACGHATSEPVVGFVCLSCGAKTDGDAIETRDIFSYELTEQGVGYLEGGNAVLGFTQASLRFSELPLDLIIALNDEAKKYNDSKTPFALAEITYRNERAIHQEGGARQFINIRKLFLENLHNAAGEGAKVIQGRAYDYVLLRGEAPADARRSADELCRTAAKDLKLDPGASATVFGPEDLR